MKLITVDNFNRENVADHLVAEGLSDYDAKFLAEAANAFVSSSDSRFFKAVPDDHKLWGGMAEFV